MKIRHCDPGCFMWTDGRMDRDSKLIVAFRNFAKSS